MKMKTSRMKSILTFILSFAVVFVLIGCVTGKQKLIDSGINPLNNSELHAFFSSQVDGSYVYYKNHKTTDVSYFPDGSIKSYQGGNVREGKYRIDNDQFCSTFTSGEHCFNFFKVGDGKYDVFLASGENHGTLTIK